MIRIFRLMQSMWLKRIVQANKMLDMFEDRKVEIAEYYHTSVENILSVHQGSNQHEIFDDISTDEKLLEAYKLRSMKSTISHMLSYTRYDEAICLLMFFNRNFPKKSRRSVKVVDYGCSVADYGLIFSKSGYSVTLCDIDTGNLDVGKWRFEKRNLSYDVIEVGLNNLYPEFKKTDIVIASEVLEHIRNPLKAVLNIYNGLNPEGYFWTSGYPVTIPKIGKSHPDHLIEAAQMREEVFRFVENHFKKLKIAKGHLFQKCTPTLG